jgi:VCBS repeat-containing protein
MNTTTLYNRTVNVTIPSNISGNYYLIYKVDAINAIPESDEINNIAFRQITINSNNPVNNPPVATNDSYTLNEDTTLTVTNPGVLSNDTDPENNTLSSVLVAAPSNGVLTLNANGSFSYTPNSNFNGNDSFTYKASDGNSFSNIASVNLTINAVNDAPVANNDSITLTNNQPTTILKATLLANDTDVDNTILSINSVSNPVNGSVSLVNGDVLFTPNTGFSGIATFNYTISDGNLTSNIATVTITIESSPANYSNIIGYGLVDAAKAVAKALNQTPFADVANTKTYNLDAIKAPEVWAAGYTGQGVIVAVLDDGFGLTYPGINYWKNTAEIPNNGIDDDGNGYVDDFDGWNAYDSNGTFRSADHGTHVMGTVGDSTYGVAYGTQIMPVQVFGSGGGSWSAVERGIYYAVANGANVINMSLGGGSVSFIKTAIAYAESQGVIVVSAAGNDQGTTPIYPAGFATEYGIAVGSVGSNGAISYFSNRAGTDSNMIYVTAPGEDIISVNGGKTGTSMSSPHVAGVVALMLSANPNLTPNQVKSILKETSGNSLQPSALALSEQIRYSNLEAFLKIDS